MAEAVTHVEFGEIEDRVLCQKYVNLSVQKKAIEADMKEIYHSVGEIVERESFEAGAEGKFIEFLPGFQLKFVHVRQWDPRRETVEFEVDLGGYRLNTTIKDLKQTLSELTARTKRDEFLAGHKPQITARLL